MLGIIFLLLSVTIVAGMGFLILRQWRIKTRLTLIFLGVGTFFAFPGGIPGALAVGLAYRYLWRSDKATLLEPLGTALGAFISALIVAPMMGLPMSPTPFMAQLGLTAQWELFLLAFLMSSVPGAVIGYVVVVALRRRKVIERLSL